MIRSLALAFLAAILFVPITLAQDPQQPTLSPAKTPVTRVHLSNKEMAVHIKNRTVPHYPEEARIARITGTVHLHVIVGTNGNVLSVEPISGHPLLTNAAVECVRKWQYKPLLLNGDPVEIDTTVDIIFSLGAKP